MSTLATTNIKHPSSASNNIVLDSAGGVDLDALTVSGSAPADSVNIDASGNLLVGTSTALSTSWGTAGGIQLAKSGSFAVSQVYSFNSVGGDGYGSYFELNRARGTQASPTVVNSGDGLGEINFSGHDGSNFIRGATIKALVDGTPGTNDMPGRIVLATTADGASSPTERMRIANNGSVFIAKTAVDRSVFGVQYEADGFVLGLTSDDTRVLEINRQSNDGDLVQFFQANTLEGTISVSGSTVAYNGAHLSRWSQIPGIDPHDKDARPEILRGTVMSNLDEMCDWIDPETDEPQANEQLNKTKISDVEGDKNVAGIFQGWDDDDDTWVNDYYLAMTGDFVIRIAAGTTVERGDLLMSAGDGTAKPQDDDIIRSKTLQSTSTNVSCTEDSYCVPCLLLVCRGRKS
jgi:hypothetical protein